MELALQAVDWAAMPLNVTVLVPRVAPKFTPVMVTAVPTGPALMDKLEMLGPVTGGGFTIRVSGRPWVRQPLVPVAVMVYVPGGVDAEVATFNVEAPAPVNDVGLNVAEAPAGNPLAVSPTLPVKPFTIRPDNEYVAPAPAVTVCEEEAAERLKSCTTRFTVVLPVKGPLPTVTVSG